MTVAMFVTRPPFRDARTRALLLYPGEEISFLYSRRKSSGDHNVCTRKVWDAKQQGC